MLGFQLQGDSLRIDPCVPKAWPGFRLTYRHRGSRGISCYEISAENPQGVCRGVASVDMDGQTLDASAAVKLLDDGQTHRLRITPG